jgi:hypothetical protein
MEPENEPVGKPPAKGGLEESHQSGRVHIGRGSPFGERAAYALVDASGGFRDPEKARLLQPEWESRASDSLARGLWNEADLAWRRERRLERVWMRWHYSLGVLAVVLAAVAGIGALADLLGPDPAAIVALASGAVGAVAVFLQSEAKREQHRRQATAWNTFRDEITRLWITQPIGERQHPNGPYGWVAVLRALETRAEALRDQRPDPQTSPREWRTRPRADR